MPITTRSTAKTCFCGPGTAVGQTAGTRLESKKDPPAGRRVSHTPWSIGLRPNHHRRRANGANDGGGANTRNRTDGRSSGSGDSIEDSSPRSIPDKARDKRVRPPSLFGAREREAQALAEIEGDIFS
jgi:hypothetical protein